MKMILDQAVEAMLPTAAIYHGQLVRADGDTIITSPFSMPELPGPNMDGPQLTTEEVIQRIKDAEDRSAMAYALERAIHGEILTMMYGYEAADMLMEMDHITAQRWANKPIGGECDFEIDMDDLRHHDGTPVERPSRMKVRIR